MPSFSDPNRRSAVAFALARALGAPAGWPDGFADLLRQSFAAGVPPLPGLAGELAEAVEAAGAAAGGLADVAVRHTKLFVGPFRPAAMPVASAWLERRDDEPAAVVLAAQRAYAEAGLDTAAIHIAPDHVVAELEFLCHLAWQETATGDPVWRDRQVRFWRDCLGPWLGRFAAGLRQAAADDPVYGAAARLLAAAEPGLRGALAEDRTDRPAGTRGA